MLDDFHTAALDWLMLAALAAIAAAAFYWGR